MEIRTPSIDQILQSLNSQSRPPSLFTLDERLAILTLLDGARTSLARAFPSWIHFFTADVGIDPRLAVVPVALSAHRQGRTVISDPTIGLLFGSFWEAAGSLPEEEITDMAALAPDQSLILIKDKVTLAGEPADRDRAAPAVWDSQRRVISWLVLPSPDIRAPGLFAALEATARSRNGDILLFRHHIRQCQEEAGRDSLFPRWVRGLYAEMTLTNVSNRAAISKRELPVPAHKAISGCVFYDELAGP